MRMLTHLALTVLLSPALLQAQAPAAAPGAAFSQQFKAGAPEVDRLIAAFETREALPKAESLLPTGKPIYDKSSANSVHVSCWTYLEMGQAYALAFRAAEGSGQWEKALVHINKAVEILKESREAGKAPLTEQANYWKGIGAEAKTRMDQNADAIKELKAKVKLEDYETESLERVKAWETQLTEGEKWSKFFQYDMDRTASDLDYYEKVAANIEKRIKSQQEEIEAYKPHPGSKDHWVEAVVATRSYMDSIPEKADKINLLYRLSVLDPENKKVEQNLMVLLGKAAPEKATAPKKSKKG